MSTASAMSSIRSVVVGVGAGEGGTIKAIDRDGRGTLDYSGLSFSLQK